MIVSTSLIFPRFANPSLVIRTNMSKKVHSVTNRGLSIETLMGEPKTIVIDNHEFEKRFLFSWVFCIHLAYQDSDPNDNVSNF